MNNTQQHNAQYIKKTTSIPSLLLLPCKNTHSLRKQSFSHPSQPNRRTSSPTYHHSIPLPRFPLASFLEPPDSFAIVRRRPVNLSSVFVPVKWSSSSQLRFSINDKKPRNTQKVDLADNLLPPFSRLRSKIEESSTQTTNVPSVLKTPGKPDNVSPDVACG